MSELKPCPFCGSTHIKLGCNDTFFYAECDDCKASGTPDLGISGSVESWNTRPIEDRLTAQRDALLAAAEAVVTYHDASIKIGATISRQIPFDLIDQLRVAIERAKKGKDG